MTKFLESMMPFLQKNKKIILALFLSILISAQTAVILFLPRSARAIPAPVEDIPAGIQRETLFGKEQTAIEARDVKLKADEEAKEVKVKVEDRWYKGLVLGAAVIVKNTLVSMSRAAAEQTVTYLATGNWGEGPMFYDAAWDKFKAAFTNQMVGQFIDNINAIFGIDICHPSIPYQFTLELFLLREGYADLKKPDCSLSEFKNNWEAFADKINEKYKSFRDNPAAASIGVLQETFTAHFVKESTDIGMLVITKEKMKAKVAEDMDSKSKQRQENQGSFAVTDITGKYIETPAYLTRSHSQSELEKAKNTQEKEVEMSKTVMTEIPGQVALAFVNSFVSKFWTDYLLKKILSTGISSPSFNFDAGNKVFNNKAYLQTELASQKINYSFSQKQIDLLSEFANCPDPRQINNCVMDNSFADAVRKASQDKPLTVQEAIDQNYLNENKYFIGKDDERNNLDDCYEIGYCYSNLVKLRSARIIPIGWEIAASLVKKGKDVTLEQMIKDFSDKESDFYHLIDPNWILRYPQTQCKALVTGPLLVASKAAERSEVCVDATNCIKYDDKGKCLSFGYCAAEKNIFRFGGQECPGQFDGCRSVKDSNDKEASYVLNTTDRLYCNADNAGCLWYSMAKKEDANNQGSLVWDDTKQKIYLNKKIIDQECSPNQEGCSRFINTAAGLGTNLLPNPGFEIFDNPLTKVNDWIWYNAANSANPTSTNPVLFNFGFSGVKSAELSDNQEIISDEIIVAPKSFTRYFALSAQVKKESATSVSANLDLVDLTTGIYATLVYPATLNKSILIDTANEWQNVRAIFSVGPSQSQNTAMLDKLAVAIKAEKGKIYVDNVILEEIDSPFLESTHIYNDYAAQNALYLKKAPAYLSCYDVANGSEDGRPETTADINLTNDFKGDSKQKGCKDFAGLCSAEEVGCEAYKPVDKGAVINGVVSYADYCPQECAGYQSYAKSATNFEDAAFPLYLIPSTADQCSASQAGCDEFTNLDTLAQGGEGKEYYSELRMCVELPEGESQCSTYYTWEGSEVTGYQLQAHALKKGSDGPDIVDAKYASLCDASVFAQKNNPDCRQFFDAAGKAYYKLLSKTILCSKDCHPYRRTDKYVDDSATATVNEANESCKERKGKYDNGECVFMAVPSKSLSCTAANNGCREYRGNQAGVEFELENYTFSGAGALDKLSVSKSVLQTSPEFGQYMTVQKLVSYSFYTKTDLMSFATGDYRLSFWLRKNNNAGTFKVQVGDFANGFVSGDKTTLTGANGEPLPEKWQFYTYNFTVNVLNQTNFGLGIMATEAFDIDNLKIVKTEDLRYLIGNSWETPQVCDYKLNSDMSNPANYMPQAQLGCREFTDPAAATRYLKSFSGLCSADKVGCQAVIDTQNNEYPFEKKFNKDNFNAGLCSLFTEQVQKDKCINNVKQKCKDENFTWNDTESRCETFADINIPADSLMYLVVNDKAKCQSSEKGCVALGLPSLTVDKDGNSVVKTEKAKDKEGNEYDAQVWKNLFFKVDPENFDSETANPLCKYFGANCEEYTTTDDETYYFKKPGDKVCEWRQGQISDQQKDYAWFKKKTNNKDTDVLCDKIATGYVKDYYNDGSKQLTKNTETTYDGWTATCPKAQDKCVAFVDPTDTAFSTVGKAYYYLNNSNIDRSSCSGVSRKAGCVLFNDTSIPSLDYAAGETYNNSDAADFGIVAAVKGEDKDTNTIIKVVRDRECTAWYDCMSSHWTWNPSKSKYEEVCDQVGLCDKMASDSESGKCEHFVDAVDNKNLLSQNKVLTTTYENRSTGWFDFDYSGMVIPDLAPVQFYNSLDVTQSKKTCTGEDNGPICVKDSDCGPSLWCQTVPPKTCGGEIGGTPCKNGDYCKKTNQECKIVIDYRLVNVSNKECKGDTILADCAGFCTDNSIIVKNGQNMNITVNDPSKCRCLNEVCVKPFGANGKFNNSMTPACRAYPEKDSPFPASTADNVNFEGANAVYAPEKPNGDFACDYRKQTYGSGAITKYLPRYPEYSPAPPSGFCADDPEKDCGCDTDSAINSGSMCMSEKCGSGDEKSGICYKIDANKKMKDYNGWEGYCLQEDLSLVKDNLPDQHPCLVWYPAQSMSGLQDFQNQYDEAGFFPSAFNYGFTDGGPYYCVNGSPDSEGKVDTARFEFRETWFAESVGEKNSSAFVQGSDFAQKCVRPEIKIKGPVKNKEGNDGNNGGVAIKASDTNDQEITLSSDKEYCLSKGDYEECDVNSSQAFLATVNNVYAQYADQKFLVDKPCFVELIKPTEVCKVGEGGNKYKPVNLYDVDAHSDPDDGSWVEIYYQCEPEKANENGNGWYYDPNGEINNLDYQNAIGNTNSGLDVEKTKTNATDWAEPGEAEGTDWKNYELEKQACKTFYSVATDVQGENKAFTNKIYQQKNITLNSVCNYGNTVVEKVAFTDLPKLYGALNYTGASTAVKDLTGIFLGTTAIDNSPDSTNYNDPWVSNELGTSTNNYTTTEGKVVWGSDKLYQGGESCLTVNNIQDSLFTKLYKKFTLIEDETKNYIVDKNTYSIDESNSDVSGSKGLPPTVAAVVATKNTDSKGNVIYGAVPGKITVSTPDGDYIGEDIVREGITQLPVTVKFYAWADDDQMPIRKISVDWGDAASIKDSDGKFQNHKPRCQQADNEKLGTCNAPGSGKVYKGYACLDDSECKHLNNTETPCVKTNNDDVKWYYDDRFGDTQQACLQSYFQYQKIYTCSKGQGGNAVKQNVPGKGSVDACKFTIGVQVKDNWDWCNTDNGGAGAYADGNVGNSCLNNQNAFEKYDGAIYIIP